MPPDGLGFTKSEGEPEKGSILFILYILSRAFDWCCPQVGAVERDDVASVDDSANRAHRVDEVAEATLAKGRCVADQDQQAASAGHRHVEALLNLQKAGP